MNENEMSQLRDDVRYLKDRTAIMDVIATHARGHDKGQAYPKGLRDERDLSYQRPLDLDEPPAEIW